MVIKPNRTFLIKGLISTAIGIGLAIVKLSGWGDPGYAIIFLSLFYLLPGIYCLLIFINYKVTLTDSELSLKGIFCKEKRINWNQIALVNRTAMKTIIFSTTDGERKLYDVFKDLNFIVDFLVRKVKRGKISDELLADWSKFYFLYSEYSTDKKQHKG